LPAEKTSKKPRTWIWPVLFVIGIAIAIFVSGLGGETGPNGLHLIKTRKEYLDVLGKANGIFLTEVAEKSDRGIPLTADDTKQLREASTLFDELNLYDPTRMGPYFANGRIHLIFGENQLAAQQLRQSIDDSIQPASDGKDKIKLLAADSELFLAQAYENMNDFQDALTVMNKAIAAYPKRADYRYTRARALIQLKKVPEAIDDLKMALVLDPKNEKAASLLRFVTAP
jgi:tetratricopeptide (TPR) repeat protein